jgi:putative chitinase
MKMEVLFDRKVFFDSVRDSLFSGTLSQQQVDGMNFKLAAWELNPRSEDLRWLSYPFATSYHETAATMWPIEEIGKGKGKLYGKPDPNTGKLYYGRGDVQLTWADNYARATKELDLSGDDDLYWHPEKALEPSISAAVMYSGMVEGWFRKHKLADYFSKTKDDAFNARDIINGDKKIVPKWSNGVSIGSLVRNYHEKFLYALKKSYREPIEPEPETTGTVTIQTEGNVRIVVNGKEV